MKLMIGLVALSLALPAFAQSHDHQHTATYFKGDQPVGIAGDVVDCFVEAEFSPKGSQVAVRALVADPHDATTLVGKSVLKAKYNSSKKGYYFLASNKEANVQQMLLTATGKKTAVGMSLTFSDEGHLDTIQCENLNVISEPELEVIEGMFLNFDQYVEEDHGHDDHDHDHDHQH